MANLTVAERTTFVVAPNGKVIATIGGVGMPAREPWGSLGADRRRGADCHCGILREGGDLRAHARLRQMIVGQHTAVRRTQRFEHLGLGRRGSCG